MRIIAVSALAIMTMIGCQVEEGNEAAEVKVSSKNAVPYEDCVDYDFEQHVFYPYDDDANEHYRVPINFRIPATICQDRLGMAVQICVENDGKKDMEVLRYMEKKDGGNSVPLVDLWGDGGQDALPPWPVEATLYQEYVSDADGRTYTFRCHEDKLLDIHVSDTDGFDEVWVGKTPDDMGKNEDKHPGDIQTECWPKSPSDCRSPTP